VAATAVVAHAFVVEYKNRNIENYINTNINYNIINKTHASVACTWHLSFTFYACNFSSAPWTIAFITIYLLPIYTR
jgi:hypothetical protein